MGVCYIYLKDYEKVRVRCINNANFSVSVCVCVCEGGGEAERGCETKSTDQLLCPARQNTAPQGRSGEGSGRLQNCYRVNHLTLIEPLSYLALTFCRHNPDSPDLLTTLGLLYMEVCIDRKKKLFFEIFFHSLCVCWLL